MKYFIFVIFFVSLFCLVSNSIPPSTFWPVVFASQLTPVVLIFNFFLLLFWIWKKSILMICPLVITLFGFNYVFVIFGFGDSIEKKDLRGRASFSVLSYNTSFFNAPIIFSNAYKDVNKNPTAISLKDWLKSNGTDIMCFQEFLDDKNSDIFNTIEEISGNGYTDYYFLTKPKHDNGVRRGLIIFSKYPIINKGEIFMDRNRYNGAAFADIKIEKDTIRVINAHLHSMELKEIHGLSSEKLVKNIFWRYKNGSIKREHQAELLMAFIKESKYKVILCGDLNETPFSFVYRDLKSILSNAFEESGKGFGFTLNNEKLFFLRIDHQFYDNFFIPTNFTINEEIKFSEHFPISVNYYF